MDSKTFDKHQRLEAFPPAKLFYILYRRFLEQGLGVTGLWLRDKVARRLHGHSPTKLSRVMQRLYVGGQQSRRGLRKMRETGIEAVVNMREESDDAARRRAGEHYLWLPTTDDAPPTLEDLEKGVDFIEGHVCAGRGVYVHCASGVGRAPTMAAAYLVSKQGLSPQEAWEKIRESRPFIRPTPPQIEVIERVAQRLRRRAEIGGEEERAP